MGWGVSRIWYSDLLPTFFLSLLGVNCAPKQCSASWTRVWSCLEGQHSLHLMSRSSDADGCTVDTIRPYIPNICLLDIAIADGVTV